MDFKKLLELYPEFSKIHGPYFSSRDGRGIINLYYEGDYKVRKSKTISLPKAMMEIKLGRKLKPNEFVDHIDNDPTNNTYSNFQLLSPADNTYKNRKRLVMELFICAECSKEFERWDKYVQRNQVKRQKGGPFCSRSCAGLYSQRIQMLKQQKPR